MSQFLRRGSALFAAEAPEISCVLKKASNASSLEFNVCLD